MTQTSPEEFFSNGTLTKLEIELVHAIEEGRDFKPDLREIGGDYIRGPLIRAALIRTPLKYHPDSGRLSRPRAVRVTPHGIRIAPVRSERKEEGQEDSAALPLLRIAGPLNLEGLAGAGGEHLPPLQLDACMFEHPITLSGAHLKSLTLKGSRFSQIEARGARINGALTLEDCRPRNEPTDPAERYFATHAFVSRTDGKHAYVALPAPRSAAAEPCRCAICTGSGQAGGGNCSHCCVVGLRAAVIEGALEIVGSYLRAPRLIGCGDREPGIWDSRAADFHGIQVRDRVRLNRSIFVGSISFVSAEVGDDIWISGTEVFAWAGSRSIDFQFATVGGVLAFQAADADSEERKAGLHRYPTLVVGQVSAIALNAAEVWIGEGFYFAHDRQKRGGFATIYFPKADVRGDFTVGAYYDYHVLDPDRPTGGAMIHGEICVQATTVGKNLLVHGADYEGIAEALRLDHPFFGNFGVNPRETPYLKLAGHGVKVDRRVHISHGNFRDADRPVPAESPADGTSQTFAEDPEPAAIDLWKSTIGIGFRIGEHVSCIGALRLNSCVIGREVIIGCRSFKPGPNDRRDACQIPCLVDIAESTIKGHLKIGRREARPGARANPARGEAQTEQQVTLEGGLHLESINVQGSILLAHITFDLGQFKLPTKPANAKPKPIDEDKRVALKLRDCVCGSDLDVHSLHWRLPELEPIELCRLDERRWWFDRFLPWRQRRRFRSIAAGPFAGIDLRGLQCGLLIDGFGAEWGLVYRLRTRLAGIKISDVEPSSHEAPHAPTKTPELSRLRWLSSQYRCQRILNEIETCEKPKPAAPSFWERYFCAQKDDFVPQAYDVFSNAYRRAGENHIAEHILVEKKNIENALRFRRLREQWGRGAWSWPGLFSLALAIAVLGEFVWLDMLPAPFDSIALGAALFAGALLVWPYLISVFQMLFRFGFRYGLSVQSAMLVFLLFILIGTGGVFWARNGGPAPVNWADRPEGELDADVVLVLDVEHEPVKREPAGPAHVRDVAARVEGQAVYARPSPCNLDVNSLLYALDVFIPLIDLDQERRCKVRDALPAAPGQRYRDDYYLWRFAKAIYELLGWIVTSLVILTVTGVLRRDLER